MYSPNDIFLRADSASTQQLLHASSSAPLGVFLDSGHLRRLTSSDIMLQGRQESRWVVARRGMSLPWTLHGTSSICPGHELANL
jgi:hypothetical protein